jgi:hypothetical protein
MPVTRKSTKPHEFISNWDNSNEIGSRSYSSSGHFCRLLCSLVREHESANSDMEIATSARHLSSHRCPLYHVSTAPVSRRRLPWQEVQNPFLMFFFPRDDEWARVKSYKERTSEANPSPL